MGTYVPCSHKKGDALYVIKSLIKKDPNMKFLASHLSKTPLLYLTDPALMKEFL